MMEFVLITNTEWLFMSAQLPEMMINCKACNVNGDVSQIISWGELVFIVVFHLPYARSSCAKNVEDRDLRAFSTAV